MAFQITMIALVVNPLSGSGRGRRLGNEWAKALSQRNEPFELISEKSLHESLQKLRKGLSASRYTKIVSVGGDGLAHYLYSEAIAHDVALFVAPGGTGNDFARNSGTFGRSTDDLVSSLTATSPQRVDMGLIQMRGEKSWYGQVLSSGFDSKVNARANRYSFAHGKLKYVIATFRELASFVPQSYEVIIDGRRLEFNAMVFAVANGNCFGGGMKVCPDADRHDGLMDILILDEVPIRTFLRVFPRLFNGTHINHPAVRIIRAKQIEIIRGEVIYADGEFVGEAPISITSVSGALKTWIL